MRLLPILFALLTLTLVGCGEVRPPAEAPIAPPSNPLVPPSAVKPMPADSTSDELKKRLSEVEAAKIALGVEAQALKGQIAQKEKEEAAEAIHRDQVWLRWFSFVCFILGILSFGASFAFTSTPLLPVVLRWAGAGLGVISALALVGAWLLPYLIWIGGALAVGVIGWLIWHGKKSDKANGQLARAVDAVKDKIPGFKEIFRQYIDTDVDKHLDAVRKRLSLK